MDKAIYRSENSNINVELEVTKAPQTNRLQSSVSPDIHCLNTGRVCAACNKFKPLDEFYSKGPRHDTRCKDCVLKAKAVSYRKRNPRSKMAPKNNVPIDVNVAEIFESPWDNSVSEIDVDGLLKDFVFEVILEA